MNFIDLIITVIAGIAIYKFADEIVEYTRYLPLFRSARDGGNPVAMKIIGILIVLYGIGMFIFVTLPRS